MKSKTINPVHFRMDTLLALGVSQVHELARKAVGTVTSYRVVLGRCLLAMRESKGFKKYGCSSEIHYGLSRLGLSKSTASSCRRVARALTDLPELTLAAELGSIEWSKLREITRKATPETEAYWLELSKRLDYAPIEFLVRKTPKGELPGDIFEEPERATNELRCVLSEEVLAMLERARRMYSLEQGQAVSTAEILEWALASYISGQPVDEDSLEKVRQDMDKDLQAQKAQEIPLVAEAREIAAEMGYLPVLQLEENDCDPARAGQKSQTVDQSLSQALGGEPCIKIADEAARAGENRRSAEQSLGQALGGEPSSKLSDEAKSPSRPQLQENNFDEAARAGQNSQSVDHPLSRALGGDAPLLELAKLNQATPTYRTSPLQSPRLCFNPRNRSVTKAQKREILRRQSWCCATAGCNHRIFIHIHHLIPYSQGGATLPENTLGLCAACHANVHEGSLRIFESPDGKLLFTDAEGNSLAKQADLELAGWLDFHQGWDGTEEDSQSHRLHSGDWAVFGELGKT